MTTNDRSLIAELLTEAATHESTSRKLELAEALNRLSEQLAPLEDGAVYTFSRPGRSVVKRGSLTIETDGVVLHYAGVVSGGKHFLTGKRFMDHATFDLTALNMAGYLLGLGVTEVTVLRPDDGITTVHRHEPASYPFITDGTRVRVVPTGIVPAFDGTVWEHRHVNEQLQYRVARDGVSTITNRAWYAASQVTAL